MADKSVTRAKLEERLWEELGGNDNRFAGRTLGTGIGEHFLQAARLLHESLVISEGQEKQRKES